MAKPVDTGSMYLLLWQEERMCQWYSLSTDVVIMISRKIQENPFSPHSPTRKASSWSILKDEMLEMNRIIESSRTWRNITDSIFVNSGGDVVLRMSRGDELFILGKPHSLKEKFAGIEKYYDYIAPSVDEGHYKTVNLKYRRQIICRQKDT